MCRVDTVAAAAIDLVLCIVPVDAEHISTQIITDESTLNRYDKIPRTKLFAEWRLFL